MLAVLVERLTFGQWLRRELDARRIGPGHVASFGHISRTAVYSYLRDERTPDPAQCRELARVLKLSETEVLAAAGHVTTPDSPVPSSVDLHPDLEVKLKLFTPEEQRRWVLPMLDLALTLREDSEGYDEPPPDTQAPPPPQQPPSRRRPSR